MKTEFCPDCGGPRHRQATRCIACHNRQKQASVEQRFWARVDKRTPEECWLWTGGENTQGYGYITVNGRRRVATHIALEFAGRPLPAGLCACHHCDNPLCVNPAHLYAGTQKENAADMLARGRAAAQGGVPEAERRELEAELARRRKTRAAERERRRRANEAARPECIACGKLLHPGSARRCWDCEVERRADLHRERDEQIVKWWAEGLMRREIADRLGMSMNALARLMGDLREAGADLPRRPGGRRKVSA